MSSKVLLIAILGCIFSAGLVLLAWQRSPAIAPTNDPFRPVRYTLPVDPTIEVPHRPIRDLPDSPEPDELVLGVTLGGESRAYPINALNHSPARKVLNDILGGEPLLVTWCDACSLGAVYHRSLGGETLTFAASGQIWKDSLVMHDMETRSLWSQLLGEAKLGKREGQRLTRIPAVLTDWRTWSQAHPAGSVAWFPYRERPFRRLAEGELAKYVLGVIGPSGARTWRLDRLVATPALNDTWLGQPVLAVLELDSRSASLYERTLDGREYHFVFEGTRLIDRETGSEWNPLTGQATSGELSGRTLRRLPAVVASREAWRGFYPGFE